MAVDQELDGLLRNAIVGKHMLRFSYKGNERIVEPHDYGIQNGTVRLLCWQVGGKSTGRLPGWRWFNAESIEGCEILNRRFAGSRDISDQHHRWDEVFMRVAPSEKAS